MNLKLNLMLPCFRKVNKIKWKNRLFSDPNGYKFSLNLNLKKKLTNGDLWVVKVVNKFWKCWTLEYVQFYNRFWSFLCFRNLFIKIFYRNSFKSVISRASFRTFHVYVVRLILYTYFQSELDLCESKCSVRRPRKPTDLYKHKNRMQAIPLKVLFLEIDTKKLLSDLKRIVYIPQVRN